jgi:hypothetical protein
VNISSGRLLPGSWKLKLDTQNSHLTALLKLVTATQTRTEINNYIYKVDVIAALLPHLDVRNMIGR